MRHREDSVRDFLKWCCKEAGLKYDRIEMAFGSTVGFPDAVVHLRANTFLPVECKFWLWDTQEQVLMVRLRPSQISWHSQAARKGIRSALLVGSLKAGVSKTIEFWVIDPLIAIAEPEGRLNPYAPGCMKVFDARSLCSALVSPVPQLFGTALHYPGELGSWWSDG